MDVAIKSFDVAMDVKNKGIELEIREPNDGAKLGNLVVTKGHLIWCPGKTQLANGKKIKWADFIEMANAVSVPAKKTAPKKSPAKVVSGRKVLVKKTRTKKTAKSAPILSSAPAPEPIAE